MELSISPSFSMINRYSPSRQHHRIRSENSTANPMMSPRFGMILLTTSSMTDTDTLRYEGLTGPNVTSSVPLAEARIPSFDKALIRNEPGSSVFIRQIWPDDVVEHVIFNGRDDGRQSRYSLGSIARFDEGSINGQTGQMIQMRVCDQNSSDDLTKYIRRIRLRRDIGKIKAHERPFFHHSFPIRVGLVNIALQRPNNPGKKCACVDSDH